jgi:serine/threonine protein phosphatase 1
MISQLFRKFRKAEQKGTTPFIPRGQRVYCIGDIHGRADLLEELHTLILADVVGFKGTKIIVYLGDYVDRGEQSSGVIETLVSNPLPEFESIFLLGNHEQALLDFIEYPVEAAAWLTFGGREALYSYGIALAHLPTIHEVPQLAERFDNELPDSHREFLHNCFESWRCGTYYFVHAGIRPGVDLDAQMPADKLWIREEFLTSEADHGAIIVHGHSIFMEPQIRPNRISIDTGAFATGVLTCLVLEGNIHRFLQTGK